MADILLQYGAKINIIVDRSRQYTLLMQFCSISMELEPLQLEMNLDVVQYLLEHGADRNLKSKDGHTAWDLSDYHCASRKIKYLLHNTKQVFFHGETG